MAGRGGPQRSVRAPDSLRIAAPSSGVAVWPTWLCTVSALQVISAGGGVDSADISLAAQAASGKAAAIAIQRWFMTLSPFHQHRRSSGATRIANRSGRGTLAIIAAHQRLAASRTPEQHQPVPGLALAADRTEERRGGKECVD